MPVSIRSVSGSMAVLEPSRTVYIVFKTPVISKAIMIGSGNKYKIPGFLDNADLVFPQVTLETRVYVTNFSNGCDNSSIMGIEGECSVRFGDVKIDKTSYRFVTRATSPPPRTVRATRTSGTMWQPSGPVRRGTSTSTDSMPPAPRRRASR